MSGDTVRAIVAEAVADFWRGQALAEPPSEEAVARVIARALGHNDEMGSHWDRYVLAARLLRREFRILAPVASTPG